ncbi:MotA/TolQ/ExbB proton channel family protein [Parendozoicomonas haliclonae]|uniref:Biopolymer transport protein ExbB n=1 Tax=Parendozoicomonas haliclonae TaxID=1960125 RepID=A0A1X7AIT2_9GAMM|nr:MotA/TolQ/ExbB proton channel family protein [Parendozoicomonas haliclonae]SMA44180.1 biopolymer transport protein ExbB [Parendozoicomonas haliclonae]
MLWLMEELESIRRFLGMGGEVLFVLFILTFLLWLLVIERYLYFFLDHPKLVKLTQGKWSSRDNKTSIHSTRIRQAMISEVTLSAQRNLPMIKTLIALCPLLGLLGTVVGMVQVFDVLAVTGTGSPRAMASGISKATIPTMAGMVAALSGLYFSALLEKRADRATHAIADSLKH